MIMICIDLLRVIVSYRISDVFNYKETNPYVLKESFLLITDIYNMYNYKEIQSLLFLRGHCIELECKTCLFTGKTQYPYCLEGLIYCINIFNLLNYRETDPYCFGGIRQFDEV